VGDNKQILKDQKTSHTNQLHKQNERDKHTGGTDTVWMSDHCKGAVGGCTKVARGLVVEVVGVQTAAMCGGTVVVGYLWKLMKYNFRMLSV